MDYKAMGTRIRSLRNNMGITQEKLAEMVGISPGFMCNIETGVKPGAFDTYVRIALVLNTTLDYLSQDILPKARENIEHETLIKYFDTLNYKQQRYVLEALRNFCDFVN